MKTGVGIASFAKINLFLDVLGKRPDGFHEVQTVMAAIDCYDRLRVRRIASGIRLKVSGPGARMGKVPADKTNLVWRAARAFLDTAGVKQGVAITLIKNIPPAAGLGGGSSNAASALLALNRLFPGPCKPRDLLRLAAGLGSDVPFFLSGGMALATGKGSKVNNLHKYMPLHLVLAGPVKNSVSGKTAKVYAAWKKPLTKSRTPISITLAAIETKNVKRLALNLHNSLEEAACVLMPFSARLRRFMRMQNVLGVLLSGAGPSVFALTESRAAALRLKKKIKRRFGKTAWVGVFRTIRRRGV